MKTYDADLRGKLAASLCGHDKGNVYVIIACDDNEAILADGRKRTVANPKRKNRKHIQPVLRLPEKVEEILSGDGLKDDLAIKRALKCYHAETGTDRTDA